MITFYKPKFLYLVSLVYLFGHLFFQEIKRNGIVSNWLKELHADTYSIATLLQTKHDDKGSHASSLNKDSSPEFAPTFFVQSPSNTQSLQARAALIEPNQRNMQFSGSKEKSSLLPDQHKSTGVNDRTRSEICVSPSWDSGKKQRGREVKRVEKEKADLEKRLKKLELEQSRRNSSESRREPRRLEKKQRLSRSSRASSVHEDIIKDTSRLPSFSGSTRASRSSSIQGFWEWGERRRSVDTMMSSLSRNLPCSDATQTMPRLSNALPERFGAAIPGDLIFREPTEISQRDQSTRSLNQKTKSPDLRSSARLAQTEDDSAHSQDKCVKLENRQPEIEMSQRNTDVDRSSFTASLGLEGRSKLKIAAKEPRTPPGVGKREESIHLTVPLSNSDRDDAVQHLKDSDSINVRNRNFITNSNQTTTAVSSASSSMHRKQREHPCGAVRGINRQNSTKTKPSPLGGPAITASDLQDAATAGGKKSGLVAKHRVNSTEKPLSTLESFKDSDPAKSITRNASLPFGLPRHDIQGGRHGQSAHPDNGELSGELYPESGPIYPSRSWRAKYFSKGQRIAEGQDKKTISHPNTEYTEERSKRTIQSLQQPSAYATENRADVLHRSNNPRVSNTIELEPPGLTINQLINNDKRILPSPSRSMPKDHQLKGSAALKHESGQCELGASVATEPLIAAPLNTIRNVKKTDLLLPVELSKRICDEGKVIQSKEPETSIFDNPTESSGRVLQRPQQPKALAASLAKLFVICCHCRFWHDIPSELYAKLALPEKIASPALVRCCWCDHGMSRSCCEGWTTIVYMHERHH